MKDPICFFTDIEAHLLKDEKPSLFLNEYASGGFLDTYPFSMISELIRIEQSPIHHPEGNVWNHTMMVLDHAADRRDLSNDPRAFMWSALLHDLGKVPATKIRKGRITAYDHDKFGEELAVRFLKEFTKDYDLIAKVAAMVRWHMQILYIVKDLPFANMKDMLMQVSLKEISLLSLCDRLGRGKMDDEKINVEIQNVDVFIMKCEEYLARN